MISLILALFTNAPAFAEAKAPYYHVIQVDPDLSVETAKGADTEVITLESRPSLSEMVPVSLQAEMLASADLTEFTTEWDGFELDRLFLRAENGEPSKVAALYEPALPVQGVSRLKAEIRKFRKAQKKGSR